MSVEGWLAIGGAAVSVLGWFIVLERRLSARLTRREHEKICEKRDAAIKEDLEQLREDMQQRYTEMERRQEKRHEENSQTLARIDTSTTGTHKRIDQMLFELNRARGTG